MLSHWKSTIIVALLMITLGQRHAAAQTLTVTSVQLVVPPTYSSWSEIGAPTGGVMSINITGTVSGVNGPFTNAWVAAGVAPGGPGDFPSLAATPANPVVVDQRLVPFSSTSYSFNIQNLPLRFGDDVYTIYFSFSDGTGTLLDWTKASFTYTYYNTITNAVATRTTLGLNTLEINVGAAFSGNDFWHLNPLQLSLVDPQNPPPFPPAHGNGSVLNSLTRFGLAFNTGLPVPPTWSYQTTFTGILVTGRFYPLTHTGYDYYGAINFSLGIPDPANLFPMGESNRFYLPGRNSWYEPHLRTFFVFIGIPLEDDYYGTQGNFSYVGLFGSDWIGTSPSYSSGGGTMSTNVVRRSTAQARKTQPIAEVAGMLRGSTTATASLAPPVRRPRSGGRNNSAIGRGRNPAAAAANTAFVVDGPGSLGGLGGLGGGGSGGTGGGGSGGGGSNNTTQGYLNFGFWTVNANNQEFSTMFSGFGDLPTPGSYGPTMTPIFNTPIQPNGIYQP